MALKEAARQHAAHHPVGLVNDFVDTQLAQHAKYGISLERFDPEMRRQCVHRVTRRIPRSLEQIRAYADTASDA